MTCMQLSSIGWIWYVHEALLAVVSSKLKFAVCENTTSPIFISNNACHGEYIFARLQTHCIMARVHSNWPVPLAFYVMSIG